MVEYGLITALVSLLSFSAVTLLGDNTEESFDDVTAAFDSSGGGGEVVTTPGDESVPGDGGASPTTTSTTTPATTTTTTAPAATTTTAPTTTTTTVPEEGGDTAVPTSSGSEISVWTATKNGGNGTWAASVDFGNDWSSDQILTLKVTTIDHKGKKKTTTVEGFQVPAGGVATFTHDDNTLKVNKGNVTGIMEIQVEVVSITTWNHAGEQVAYPQSGATTSISRPDLP
jgi:Flp pilus assembly pilin Flp